MFGRLRGLICVALIAVLAGCGPGGVKEQQIEVKASNDPLNMPRSILQRYSEGQALGSEVTGFPNMVEAVRKVDKVRADVLEAGLKEIQDAPAAKRKALAKDLLAKLQPSMTRLWLLPAPCLDCPAISVKVCPGTVWQFADLQKSPLPDG